MYDRRLSTLLFWLLVFAVPFGYLEGTVVVYLRALYYPEGFAFPLAIPDPRILGMELGREGATLLMLGGAAMLAGRTGWERFGAFAFLFGVWDLVYYLTLWLALGWPRGLFTWDVLFLLPLVWAGPVISAAWVAVSLVVGGVLILRQQDRGMVPVADARVWIGAGFSLALLLVAFMSNHGVVRSGGVPDSFPWIPYLLGWVLGWGSFRRAFFPRRRFP